MPTHTQYQDGSIYLAKRAKGPDVWLLRYRTAPDETGKRKHLGKIIGTLREYPTKNDAKRAAANLRAEINAAEDKAGKLTVRDAWGHFQAHELRNPAAARSPSTIKNYLEYFRVWLLPHWGLTPLDEVKAVRVEAWLHSLTSLAPGTKAKLRNHLSALFSHCIRHELYDKTNPIASVRQSAKRVKEPTVFTVEEIAAIIMRVENEPARVMLILAASTGLRKSEFRGLRWCDVDTTGLWFHLRQGLVGKEQTNLKTEASRRGLPMHPELAVTLADWRESTPYNRDDDWVFASPYSDGKQPYWPDQILVNHIRPAAAKAGIQKTVNWHAFRHSLGTALKANGEDVKTIQELLRHANSRITLDVYTQGNVDAKRSALSTMSGLFVVKKDAA
ncbi:tyrosine-type recombinase/integrase [Granulicella cerasi]|uniref:Tyrosine-type recombinase/integrase n=1 Tax=Granulicella cerasi TaxID=741063 RepID=A0ABW1Z5N0_9BACT|nr:site-specific integrase [Granulicella cerasi]